MVGRGFDRLTCVYFCAKHCKVAAAVVRRDTGPTHDVLYLPGKGIVVQAAKGHGGRVNGQSIRLRKGQASEGVTGASTLWNALLAGDFVLHQVPGNFTRETIIGGAPTRLSCGTSTAHPDRGARFVFR